MVTVLGCERLGFCMCSSELLLFVFFPSRTPGSDKALVLLLLRFDTLFDSDWKSFRVLFLQSTVNFLLEFDDLNFILDLIGFAVPEY